MGHKHLALAVGQLIIAIWLSGTVSAKQMEFEPSWNDGSNTFTNLSRFLDAPAGKHGFVKVCGEHLCFEDGNRARFWGVNITGTGCCPPKDQADQIAAHIAKLGFNAVRLHHLASSWVMGQIIDNSLPGYQKHLQLLDNFDYFASRLKARGIYLFLPSNHDSPWFLVPEVHDAAGLKDGDRRDRHFTRYATIFDPLLQEQQKKFINILLSHRNPYTGLIYAEDPMVAFFEIANENSATDNKAVMDDLPPYYQGELDSLWNQFLANKYKSIQDAYDAWGWCDSSSSSNLLDASLLEKHNGANATVIQSIYSVMVSITNPGTEQWHVQYTWRNVPLQACKKYTLSFRARSSTLRTAGVILQEQGPPWRGVGLNTTINLDTTFKDFSFDFIALPTNNPYKVALLLGGQNGDVELQDATLVESPLPQTLPRPVYWRTLQTSKQIQDYFEFLADLDRKYYSTMKNFIEQQGYKGVIIGTQAATTLGVEAIGDVMDTIDAHGYWDHPRFPSTPWSSTDWFINNKSMVLSPEKSPLALISWRKIKGKPFIVSEYNHAFPNEYDVEAIPFLAAYAGAQDWDGVFLYHLDVDPENIANRKSHFFSLQKQAGKMATLPLGRVLFESVKPFSKEIVITIPRAAVPMLRTQTWYHLQNILSLGVDPAEFKDSKVSITFGTSLSVIRNSTDAPFQVHWMVDKNAQTGKLIINTDRARAVVGYVYKESLGDIQVNTLEPTFAVIGINSMDNKPLDKSNEKLLVVAGKTEIPGMQWNKTKTSVGNKWGNSKSTVHIPEMDIIFGKQVSVKSLDENGNTIEEKKDTFFQIR